MKVSEGLIEGGPVGARTVRAEPETTAPTAAEPNAAASAEDDSCPNCTEALAGVYCHRCGEKRPEARDLTVRHFVHDAAQELTSLDSKLFRTVLALLFRPGFLTLEWIRGRRSHYLKPLNLCLGVFAVGIFAYSAYKPVSIYDISNVVEQDKTGVFGRMLDKQAAKKHEEPQTLRDEISDKWQHFMSVSPLVFIVSFALVLQLVFVLTRRYFVEHLVFSMHFVSFSMLSVTLLWPVYFLIGIKPGGINTFVALFKWLLDIVYMFFAVRAVYRLGTARTFIVSLLLIVGYFVSYLLVFIGSLVAAIIATVK
ncbi:MAG TPA: DUF3667 domain-containing protein [Pyrinomonadaceae bacterium]|jgi:hypothetical protein|nr:DUF3667 domain-containing protein [Pyrinomonadaceae bacterium]